MTRILLARHGETDWNASGKLQGRTDIPLNERGKEQARELALRMDGVRITSVTSSSLSRAVETGAIVARALGVESTHVDEELCERYFGIFEGLTRDECASQHPEAWKAWVAQTSPPEGAEPFDDAIARMTRAIARVADRASDSISLVVSHGGVMRLWLQRVLGTTIPLIGNGTVYEIDHNGPDVRASRWEDG
jgi:glucosyl-3-phosphoglycerate phosphatase